MATTTELWAPGRVERYRHALQLEWELFEDAYYATVKRVGLQSMSSQHAQNYMRRAQLLKTMVEGLLAKPTRTAETPDAIRKAVADLHSYRRSVLDL